MTVLITMAGTATRFRRQGYKVPKHMIQAKGRTLFEWSMQSLKKFNDQKFVFACLDEHDSNWIEHQAKALGIRKVSVLPRQKPSLGQAETAYDAMAKVDPNEVIWIYNIDTFIDRGLSPNDIDGYQGCVHVFKSVSPSMSFVRYGDDGQVVELAEKQVISNWATVGMYGFETAKLYRQLYEESYQKGNVKEIIGERYIAPMYKMLLLSGGKVSAPKLDNSSVFILGTPEEVHNFDPSVRAPFGSAEGNEN